MIEILNKKDCCGCSACVEICPKHCISFEEDYEGFRYPLVDNDVCIQCGMCEKVCPVIHQDNPVIPIRCFAGRFQDDDVRKNSSSGGIFTALALEVLKRRGIVFGAMYDDSWEVKHGYIETAEDLYKLRTSKYLQSRMGKSFLEAKRFLKAGRLVLFSGTPCHIAGLRNFLQRDYDKLLTVDFVCHGVPSPKVWRKFLKEMQKKTELPHCDKQIIPTQINFRDKTYGWTKYSLKMNFTNGILSRDGEIIQPYQDSPYFKAFLSNISLRPSCYSCPARSNKSHSDMTIADFWGIEKVRPEFADEKGISTIFVNTKAAEEYVGRMGIDLCPVSFEEAVRYNPSYDSQTSYNPDRKRFFKHIDDTDGVIDLIHKCTHRSILRKIYYRLRY
jgi:coenzyme F420-reducing hydrogenase beta subunit